MGKVTLETRGRALVRLVPGELALTGAHAPDAVMNRAATQLQEYLAGRRRLFDLPLDPPGTAFQREVWHVLELIPYGETRTYAEVAEAVGRPGAARAIGGANRANPIPIIIPCHRVLPASGGIGGYAYGQKLKRYLLELEQRNASYA
jgi:methylated-DNA-[protein]-cysteine S-methyltransferase